MAFLSNRKIEQNEGDFLSLGLLKGAVFVFLRFLVAANHSSVSRRDRMRPA